MRRTLSAQLVIILVAMCGAAGAVAQSAAPEATPAESNEIKGRVVSESGQPLSGVSVSALRSGGSSGQRTSTDSEGYFDLRSLDAGLYRLYASLPGYVVLTPQTDPNGSNFYRPGDSAALTLIKGGVIAGVITNINGEPVINVNVRAFRIRDADGNKVRSVAYVQPRITDDRGYYRLYGLMPGAYIVCAGGPGQYFGVVNPFAKDAPTYAPASTRDTAAEFVVRSDQEVTADIRYRGDSGHVISGKITGTLPSALSEVGVQLSDIESRSVIANAGATGDERAFQLNGISDGEYEIGALAAGAPNSDLNISAPRRIVVKGSDVTGLELVLTPMGSISARVVIEADQKLNCGRRRDNALRETMILVNRERAEEKAGSPPIKDKGVDEFDSAFFPTNAERAPNDKGEVNLRNLLPGTYRLDVRLPGAGWYTRDLSLDQPDQKGAAGRQAATNIARNGITVKATDKSTAVTIAVTEGGAGLRGRVTTAEGQTLPPGLRIYLVPAERENFENVLRFFEGGTAPDGRFAIGNIAPGRYRIIAQPAEQVDAGTLKSIKTDGALRAKLLREVEDVKQEISFKPCERTVDYELQFRSQNMKP